MRENKRGIKWLRQERADLRNEALEILDRADNAQRVPTAEETARLTAIKGRQAQLEIEVAAEERAMDLRRQLDPADAADTAKTGPATGKRFRDMFPNANTDSGGFKDFAEFLSVVHSGRFDDRLNRLQVSAAMGEGLGSTGGFSVPEQFSAWLLDNSLEGEIVRPRATVYPMTSDTRKIAGFDGATHTSTLYGGLTGTWLAENSTATEVDAALRLIQLQARKLACFTRVSNELVADGLSLEEQLGRALVKTVGWFLDYAFLRGTGAGQPLGILSATSRVSVSKETGQVADTIVYENLCKMFARLAPQCVGNSMWICNNTAIPQLLQLSIPVGTGGSFIPAMTENNGQFRLLSRPVIFTEKLPAVGDEGDIVLCDLSQYAVGLRKEIALDKSIHVGWLADQAGYRAIVRADGMPTWNAAITPKAGDSLSWCVTLAAR